MCNKSRLFSKQPAVRLFANFKFFDVTAGSNSESVLTYFETKKVWLIYAFLVSCIFSLPTPSYAQAVTWNEIDIGFATPAGNFTYTAGSPPTYTVQGSGAGYTGLEGEQLAFAQTDAAGNIEIEAQLASQSSTTNNASAGLMMRESDIQVGSMAALNVTVGSGIVFTYRPGAYQSTVTVNGPTTTLPVYLKLARSGNTITGSYSADNIVWNTVGSYTLTNVMAPKYFVGFAVSNFGQPSLNTAVFKYVTYSASVPQPSANLLLWLRDDLGIVTSTGTVSTWHDQSGNGHDATQTTSTLRPSFTAGAINNAVLPTVSFNGTSQYLTMASDFANLTAGASIFLVMKPTNTTSTGVPCALGNAANSDAIFPEIINSEASMTANNGTTTSTVTSPTGAISSSSYQLLETILLPGTGAGTATGTVYVNGVQKAQLTTMQNLNNITRVSDLIGAGIGPANYFNGGIAEVLIYNTALTSSQRASVESYALSKFGIGTKPTLDPAIFSISTAPLYLPGQAVTLSQTQNGIVYYTTDGSVPQVSDTSRWYNSTPIDVTRYPTISTIASAPFFNNSSVATATFKFDANSLPLTRTGLVMWLRSDYLNTSGSNVTQWSDLSGAANNATQTVSANQPTLSLNAINGLPAVNFATSKFLQVPSGMANFTSGLSFFAVIKPTAVTANARIIDFGNGATNDNIQVQEPASTSAALFLYNGTTASSVTSASAITLNKFQVLECFADGAGNGSIFTNGVLGSQSPSMALLNNLTRANNYIGQGSAGGNYFQGQLAELIVYNRGLTSAEQAALEGYLFSRYQIQASASVPAPVISVPTSTLTSPTQVAIESSSAATIYNTTDGSTPTTSSSIYTKPLNVYYTQTVKAIAVVNGVSSSVASATYTLDATKWPAPGATTAPLQFDLQLPTTGIPQDSNQH
jgi:Concanavalin A-like lectin/glucanases superfamily/Fn3 associated/Chitobiase/beta-hexosaminidase C-terminal domain